MNDIERLERIYGAAGRELRRILSLEPGVARVRAREIVKVLNMAVNKWANDAIPRAYAKGARRTRTSLEILGRKRRHPPIEDRPRRLIDDLMILLLRANNSIPATVDRYLSAVAMADRTVGSARVREFSFSQAEGDIGRLAAEAELKEKSRGWLSQQVKVFLRTLIEDDEFIEINGRMYRMNKYAELVARTAMRESQTAATLDMCREYENDLVVISDHGTDCEECEEYEGKTYSISGTSTEYPMLEDEPPFHPNSYSKDTEIYTEAGWRNVQEIQKDDKCLSLNPETLDLEYVPIVGLVSHAQAEMIHFYDHDFDIMVTPDHDMFYLSDWKYKYRKVGFEFRQAKTLLKTKSGAFYRSSRWAGDGPLFIGELSIEDYCLFMGYYLSEGSRAGESGICISQAPGWKKDIMRRDLERMGLSIKEYDGLFRIRASRRLNQHLKQFGKSFEKFIPAEIKNSPAPCIRLFLDAYRLGDGSTRKPGPYKGGNFREERTYFTSSKRMADDLGELILKVGKRPSFNLQKTKGVAVKHKNGVYVGNHDIWVIRECSSQFATLMNMKRDIVPYGDMVFCVELAKYHTLWVRRNGKTAWCGNCKHVLLATSEAAIEVQKEYGETDLAKQIREGQEAIQWSNVR